MADMEQVKTTIGENNPFPLFPEVFDDYAEGFSILDLLFHLILLALSLDQTYQIWLIESTLMLYPRKEIGIQENKKTPFDQEVSVI